LKNHPNFEKISEVEGKVIVHFKNKVDAGQLNKYLFDKGIVLNHLVNKKVSLEEQFLALTNN
jgi:ABC-2 type transport system ATP-binding protein